MPTPAVAAANATSVPRAKAHSPQADSGSAAGAQNSLSSPVPRVMTTTPTRGASASVCYGFSRFHRADYATVLVMLLMSSPATFLTIVEAHFPLQDAASAGPAFATLDSALEVMKIDRSQATNRVALCAYPYFWFRFDAPPDFTTLMVGGTVPVIERFWDVRVAAAVIGPGLGDNASVAALPAAVRAQIPEGMGAVGVPGVSDQTTCDFTEDPLSSGEMMGGYQPYQPRREDAAPFASLFEWPTPRCFYHEEWAGSDMWIVQDKLVELEASGTHYLVFWAPGDQLLGEPLTTAKYGVVFGDKGQSENFEGDAVNIGDCAQPDADFYEMDCHGSGRTGFVPTMLAIWRSFLSTWQWLIPDDFLVFLTGPNDECNPQYGLAVPNYYQCNVPSATTSSCNSLCHNHDMCPAGKTACTASSDDGVTIDSFTAARCVETCAWQECGAEDPNAMRGPVAGGCPSSCFETGSNNVMRAMAEGCPSEECLGDFSNHDHSD